MVEDMWVFKKRRKLVLMWAGPRHNISLQWVQGPFLLDS